MQLIKALSVITIYLCLLSACTAPQESRPEFKKHYDKYQVEGSFILYDLQKDHYIFYNPERVNTRFTPAATFQILSSLIALDTGIAKDESFVLNWDGTSYDHQPWNQDQDLKTAMQHSTFWYHQELINRAGLERIQQYLELTDYGNKDISSGQDTFWLQGSLQISPLEQLTFLQKLYKEELPFSKETLDKVKDMLVLEDTVRYKLSGKTGWGLHEDTNTGWFIGYLEQNNNKYVFVNNIQATNPELKNFIYARRAITESILKELSLL